MMLIEKDVLEKAIGQPMTEDAWIEANDFYHNTSMNEDEFVEAYVSQDFFKMMREMNRQIDAYETRARYSYGKALEFARDILELTEGKEETSIRDKVRDMIGMDDYITICLEKGFSLSREDKKYILEHLVFD